MAEALDLWVLFVQYTFGNFWLALLGLSLVMFVIMMLGRMSIYSSVMYLIMFWLVMAIGYAYITISIIITIVLLSAAIFSVISYLNTR
jgi:hypothetical protein